MKKLLLIITFILSFATYAELKLPSIFSDGMVLQRNKDVTIWGITEPLSKVQLFFAEQVYEVKSNKDGKFKGHINFIPHFDYSYDGVMRSFDQSIHRLAVPEIDICLIHDVDRYTFGDEVDHCLKLQ